MDATRTIEHRGWTVEVLYREPLTGWMADCRRGYFRTSLAGRQFLLAEDIQFDAAEEADAIERVVAAIDRHIAAANDPRLHRLEWAATL